MQIQLHAVKLRPFTMWKEAKNVPLRGTGVADANLETQPGGTEHWYQVAAPGMNHRQKSPPGSGCGRCGPCRDSA